VEFLSIFNVKPPLHERKAPPAQEQRPPIDDFLATVLKQPIIFLWSSTLKDALSL